MASVITCWCCRGEGYIYDDGDRCDNAHRFRACPVCHGTKAVSVSDRREKEVRKPKMTNGEWFNSLSDRQKAKYLANKIGCASANSHTVLTGMYVEPEEATVEYWEKWFAEEHREEDEPKWLRDVD